MLPLVTGGQMPSALEVSRDVGCGIWDIQRQEGPMVACVVAYCVLHEISTPQAD